jgi:WD40 repeat protein
LARTISSRGRDAGSRSISQRSLDNHVLAIHRDQDNLIYLGDIIDLNHPVPIGTVRSDQNLEQFVLAYRGRLLITFDMDHTVRVWDLTDPRHPGAGTVLDGSRNTQQLVALKNEILVAVPDRDIARWDLNDPRHVAKRGELPIRAEEILAARDDQILVTTSSNTQSIEFWDVTNLDRPAVRARYVDTEMNRSVGSLFASPDKQIVAAHSFSDNMRYWDVRSPTDISERRDLPATADSLEFSPDNHTLATGVRDDIFGTGIRLWELDPDRQYREWCSITGNIITLAERERYVPNRPYRQPC